MRAIPTEYKGVKFRSRTEARWAFFFEISRINFAYEADGFDLDGVWYLPDFWLPDGQCFFEVKPFAPTPPEERKAIALAAGTGRMVFIAPGQPSCDLGIIAYSSSGRLPGDWRFAYGHECGPAYLTENLNSQDCRFVSLKQGAGSMIAMGYGADQELNLALRKQFF